MDDLDNFFDMEGLDLFLKKIIRKIRNYVEKILFIIKELIINLVVFF